MPSISVSDEELGLGDLLRIFPDTWNNISWAITNSVETLVKQAIDERRLLEEVKEYTIRANKDHLISIDKAIEKAALETGRLKQDVGLIEQEFMRKIKDMDAKTGQMMAASDGRVERFSIELDGKLTLVNQKIDKVQTWEYIDLVMQERIKEVNDDLISKINTQENKVEAQI
jgi:hypothetical protein